MKFGIVHKGLKKHSTRVAEREKERNNRGMTHLDATLACPLNLMVICLGAAWAGAGTLPQEVEGAAITGPRWALTAKQQPKEIRKSG